MDLQGKVSQLEAELELLKRQMRAFMSTQGRRFLSVAQIAEKYNWSRRFVYDLLQREKLTPYKAGKRTMLLESEVIEFINAGKQVIE